MNTRLGKVRCFVIAVGVILVSSCVTYGNYPPPEAAFWGKDGYSYLETQDYVYDNCFLSEVYSSEEYIEFQECMLEAGFIYMDGRHDKFISMQGFASVNKFRRSCFKGGYNYETPGCKSLRNRQDLD